MARLVAGPHSQPGRTKWRLPGSFQRHYRCRHQGGAVKPIPVVFHLGPLQIHTYGIGLALTFWFAYRYFAKRLRDHGYPDAWFSRVFIWIVIASVIGARAVHVVANLRGVQGYAQNPGDILAIWHGGLSSYGGLLGGVPTGLICALTLVSPAPPWRGSRPDRAGPGHRLDSGSAARSPAHVPGRWEPDARLVRHGLCRPGRKARAGTDLPGSRRLGRLCLRVCGWNEGLFAGEARSGSWSPLPSLCTVPLGSTTSTCFYLTALVETSRFWSHRSPLWVAAQRLRAGSCGETGASPTLRSPIPGEHR